MSYNSNSSLTVFSYGVLALEFPDWLWHATWRYGIRGIDVCTSDLLVLDCVLGKGSVFVPIDLAMQYGTEP
jgi:hypothetical protein